MIEGMQEVLKAKLRKCSNQTTINMAGKTSSGTDDVECGITDKDSLESIDDNDEEDDVSDYEPRTNDSGIDDDKYVDGVSKPRNTRPDWFPLVTFTTEEQYIDYIKRETFSVHKTLDTKKITNRYLRCTLVRKIGPQCASRLCVRSSKNEDTWCVFTNGRHHTHQQINNKKVPKVSRKNSQILWPLELPVTTTVNFNPIITNVADKNGGSENVESKITDKYSLKSTFDEDDVCKYEPERANDSEIDDKKHVDGVTEACNTRPNWFPLIRFITEEEYNDFIKREPFSVHKTVTRKKAINRYLRCTLVKKVGPQCATRLCVRLSNNEDTWCVFTNGLEHTHQQINNKKVPKVSRKKTQLPSTKVRPIGTIANSDPTKAIGKGMKCETEFIITSESVIHTVRESYEHSTPDFSNINQRDSSFAQSSTSTERLNRRGNAKNNFTDYDPLALIDTNIKSELEYFE